MRNINEEETKPLSESGKVIKEIKEILNKSDSGMIENMKKLFYNTALNAGASREEWREIFPKWCKAIDNLPDTDWKIAMEFMEITLDIIKRGREEYVNKWRKLVSSTGVKL